jgi:hypothetical protein
VKCWNCAAENDLDAVQTCAACGAPLMSRGGLFQKPIVLGVALTILLLQAAAVLSILSLRGCR